MNYKKFLSKIEIYKEKYNVKIIGHTKFNRKIMAVEIVKNEQFPTAILIAGVHAREHITSDLLCKMLDENVFDEIENFNISLIVMANPDGIELSNYGLLSVPENYREELLKMNNGNFDFSLWKANGMGVDINNNFDANFGTNVWSKKNSPSGYIGEFAESELETIAIKNYTIEKNPFFTISYHSKGEEIYFNFFQKGERLKRDELIANHFSESTGYVIKNVEWVSSGGYKDFCVQKLKIPALTLEVGSDDLIHPISENFLNEIYNKHKNIAKDLIFAYNVYKDFKNINGSD